MSNIRIKDLEKSSPGFQAIVTDVAGVPGYTVLSTSLVPEGNNLYFTNSRARAALTGINGINYDSATGIISISSIGIETDPIFTASPAFAITTNEIYQWNLAYGWGNHASAGYTIDSNLDSKVNYSAYELIDSSANVSANWSTRILLSSNGINTIDWQNSATYDNASVKSIDWTNRFMIDASNNRSIDWANRRLLSPSASVIVDWRMQRMYDNSNLSIDWGAKIMYYNGGANASINWGASTIFDNAANVSIDYNARRMYNSVGDLTFDWNSAATLSVSVLNDASAKLSIDVYNRALYYTDGTTKLMDWSNGYIYDTASFFSIGFFERYLRDGSGAVSIDWGLRALKDQANVNSIDWEARVTYDLNGVASMSYDNRILKYLSGRAAVQWQNGTICDDSTSNYLSVDWLGRHLNDDAGVVSIDYGVRALKNSSGVFTLNWQQANMNDTNNNAIAHWGIMGNNKVFEILTGCFLQIDDTYAGSSFASHSLQVNTQNAYGNANTAVLGTPDIWFKIVNSSGGAYYVPGYSAS